MISALVAFPGLVAFAIWVFIDARSRRTRTPFLWAFGTLFLFIVVVPLYFSQRALKTGETRAGGLGWNFFRNFALVFCCVIGLQALLAAVDEVFAPTSADLLGELLAIAIGSVLISVVVGGAAMLLAFVLRRRSVVEQGATVSPNATTRPAGYPRYPFDTRG